MEDEVLLAQIHRKLDEYSDLAQDDVTHLGSQEDSEISSVLDERRAQVCGTLQVAKQFRAYYADLYRLRITYNAQAIADYLEHIAMKLLTDAHKEQLMTPLRPAEIVAALKDMSDGKAPGSTRLTVAFCKAYQDKLIPL
ncbi:hypothetical protein NDU88_006884 [Pleurodeles waltl]|uniref:Uncharacterized protein n=1 Tax=Pleurodeles waltl TaxID=8319 RepID=A0AAV7SQW6_PLEWA|nr:hypothetical protein NDU88_006884 [Pleurodeles waltl]